MEEEKKVIPKQAEKCPECGSINLIYDYEVGEIVCGDCGLVFKEQMIDRGPERRAFTNEEKAKRTRVGLPVTFSRHESLSTTLKPVYRDAFGRILKPTTLFVVSRLSRWQDRSRIDSSIERNLTRAMTELNRLAENISIPLPIKEKAAIIYRKALTKDLQRKDSTRKSIIRGRSIDGIVAASVYIACRDNGIPRTLKEIADASLVDGKAVGRYARFLLQELNIRAPVIDPIKYLLKIAEKTGISGKIQGRAIEILQRAKEKGMWAGRSREGLAAAALYIAYLLENEREEDGEYNSYSLRMRRHSARATQGEIAKAAGITEVTVRNRYKELVKRLNIKIPTKSEKFALFLCMRKA